MGGGARHHLCIPISCLELCTCTLWGTEYFLSLCRHQSGFHPQEEMDMRDKQADEGAYDYQEDFSTAGEGPAPLLLLLSILFTSLCMCWFLMRALLWCGRAACTGIC